MNAIIAARRLAVQYGEEGHDGLFRLEVEKLDIAPLALHAVVGPSGAGKSTLFGALLGTVPVEHGAVRYDIDQRGDFSLCDLIGSRRRAFLRQVGFVYQAPRASLNHRRRVVDVVAEPLHVHGIGPRAGRRGVALEILEKVGIEGEKALQTPAELSGGQCQRVAIARAVVHRPRLLFLDEPTSALDVSVQASVLKLLLELRDEFGLTCVIITHDLALVDNVADSVTALEVMERSGSAGGGRLSSCAGTWNAREWTASQMAH
jgi:peptide/nickel transport system ATP-binding protein